jgi:hypothetical protein
VEKKKKKDDEEEEGEARVVTALRIVSNAELADVFRSWTTFAVSQPEILMPNGLITITVFVLFNGCN